MRWVWYYTWNYTKNEDFKQHSLASFQRYIVSTQWVECSLYIVVCHGDSVSAALCSHLEHRLQTERFRGLYQSFGGCRAFLGRFPPWLEWTVFKIPIIRLPCVRKINFSHSIQTVGKRRAEGYLPWAWLQRWIWITGRRSWKKLLTSGQSWQYAALLHRAHTTFCSLFPSPNDQ